MKNIIQDSELSKHGLELLFKDHTTQMYVKVQGTDTFRLTLDLVEKTIAVEVYDFNDQIHTTIFENLKDALKCMQVCQNFYLHVLDNIKNI